MAIFALVGCSTAPDAGPVLTIEGGQIQGVESEVKGVTVFKGIPDFRQTRIAMLRATTTDELTAILEDCRHRLAGLK